MKRALVLASLLLAAACQGSSDARAPSVIVLGVDGMDPAFVRRHADVLPNLTGLAQTGTFVDLQTTIPPQSPVAWSTVITGRDPGGHGIFDFIHRRPQTVSPYSSMAETVDATRTLRIGDYVIPLSGATTRTLRRGRPFWSALREAGIPAVVTRMPANFPPPDDGARGLSGMGTPDMFGSFGTFAYYTDDPDESRTKVRGGQIHAVHVDKRGRIHTRIHGPVNSRRVDRPRTSVPLIVDLDPDRPVARIQVGDAVRVLQEGEWSDWVRVEFPLIPVLENAHGMVRFHLSEVRPTFRLYMSPVNIDPRDPALPISAPADHASQLAAAVGPFYTQGMPVDTKAYSAGALSRRELIEQARIVLAESTALYEHQLDTHTGGLFFFYFAVVDQMSHMLWGQHEDELLEFYVAIDDLVGRTLDRMPKDSLLIVMSDHGFQAYETQVHLNHWLADEGYLTLADPDAADLPAFAGVDWSQTRAYALGFNGLYVNRRGREGHGIVPEDEAAALVAELTQRLLALTDPKTGAHVVERVDDPRKIFSGEALAMAPDLIVGYAPPYRQSDAAGLGRVGTQTFEANTGLWIGDHCMAANRVPGVLFSNRHLAENGASLADIPVTVLDAFGLSASDDMKGHSLQ